MNDDDLKAIGHRLQEQRARIEELELKLAEAIADQLASDGLAEAQTRAIEVLSDKLVESNHWRDQHRADAIRLADDVVRLQEQIAAVESQRDEARQENEQWKSELDAVRSQAQKDNLRAEDADRYELWLLDIGKSIGCGHLDERLPRCVEQEVDSLTSEGAALRADAERYQQRLQYIRKNISDNCAIRFAIESEDQHFDAAQAGGEQ